MSGDGMFILAGAIAFAGNAKESGGFPPNGYATVGGTIALTFLSSLTKDSSIAPVMRALAGLTLLVSLYYYVPILVPKEKSKTHG